MKDNKETLKRKSVYNSDRLTYLTADGKYYCYKILDGKGRVVTTQKFEVGKDLSLELTLILDEDDHATDLGDRYEAEHRDAIFDTKVASYEKDPGNEDAVNPWDTLPAKSNDPADIVCGEDEELENPDVIKVREVVDTKFTEAQKDLFFEHYGCGTSLEEIRQIEAMAKGREPVSAQAMTNRLNKMIDKTAKAFGEERIKRRLYPKKS